MKTMKNLMAIMIAVMLVGGLAFSASAQQKCCDKSGKGLNLTEEQQKKIDVLKTAMIKDKISFKNQVDEKKAHLKTLAMADVVDMTGINKTIDEMYAIKAEFAKKKAAHVQEVRKVLNDEQRLQFDMKHNCKGHDGKGMGDGACCPQQKQGCQGQGHGAGSGCQTQQKQGCQGQGQGTGAGCQTHQKQGDGSGCQPQKSGQGKGCQHSKTDDSK